MANKFEVVEDASAASAADIIVVRRLTDPLMMPDNKIGKCSWCKKKIQYRPHNPTKPKMVCDVCIAPHLDRAFENDELQIMVSKRSYIEAMDEAIAFIKRNNQTEH